MSHAWRRPTRQARTPTDRTIDALAHQAAERKNGPRRSRVWIEVSGMEVRHDDAVAII
jgi:hypothetical protein